MHMGEKVVGGPLVALDGACDEIADPLIPVIAHRSMVPWGRTISGSTPVVVPRTVTSRRASTHVPRLPRSGCTHTDREPPPVAWLRAVRRRARLVRHEVSSGRVRSPGLRRGGVTPQGCGIP